MISRCALTAIVRCIVCGDKIKNINDGETYLMIRCVGPVCDWCELRDWWGTPRDSCAGLAPRTVGQIRITMRGAA